MKLFLFVLLLASSLAGTAQNKDEQAIRKLLQVQTEAWNRGSIDAFMEGYWKSDSLMFTGKSGITYGWTKTLENYKKGYPDTAAMGKLNFDLQLVKGLSPEYFQVVGKWHLARSIGDLAGYFTLLLRKMNGEWVIVSDHSS